MERDLEQVLNTLSKPVSEDPPPGGVRISFATASELFFGTCSGNVFRNHSRTLYENGTNNKQKVLINTKKQNPFAKHIVYANYA